MSPCKYFSKVFIEFILIVLLSYVLSFWLQGMWDLSFWIRDGNCTPALEGEVLTTGLPGKPHPVSIFKGWRDFFRDHIGLGWRRSE